MFQYLGPSILRILWEELKSAKYYVIQCNDLTKNLDQTELKANLISNFGAKFVDKFRHTMMWRKIWHKVNSKQFHGKVRSLKSLILVVVLLSVIPILTVILPDWTLKNGVTLILPSSISRNSSAHNAKRIFEILWGILKGRTNSAWPSQPCLKNCQNGTF